MWNFVKNVLLVLGVLSIIYTAMNLWDRFHQSAKPNIERFIASVDSPDEAGDTGDANLQRLAAFLSRNVGRRVYLDVDFFFGDRNTIRPARIPSSDEAVEVQFRGSCELNCASVKAKYYSNT